jgi:hypothetical protein
MHGCHRERERQGEHKRTCIDLRRQGVDTVSHTVEVNALHHYVLRKNKRKGLFGKQEANLSDVLFPRIGPRNYQPGEEIVAYTKYVASKRNPIPFDIYALPGCGGPLPVNSSTTQPQHQIESNLGTQMFGIQSRPSHFKIEIKRDVQCRPLCQRRLDPQHVRWLQSLVADQYRVHLTLDGLPMTMRSRELNYITQGYPLGFRAPPAPPDMKLWIFFCTTTSDL